LYFRLQRLIEDFEYSEILDKAAQCTDNCEQVSLSKMIYVLQTETMIYAEVEILVASNQRPVVDKTLIAFNL